MKKVVYLSVLNKERDQEAAKNLSAEAGRYGLAPAGHFWEDQLEKMTWAAPREDLVKKETGLWVIVGSADDLARDSLRYGLSMLALGVQAQKGHNFPIMLAVTGGEVDPDTLPTPLKGVEVHPYKSGLGAKMVAKANMPVKPDPAEYALDTYGIEGVGQWFEVSPGQGHEWPGVMFGAAGGEIAAHGVGPAHKLPERAVLEYPMKGMKLQLGDTEYTAWAVKNKLTDADAYYLKVNDYPESIIFGPLSETDDAEVFVVKLK
jgi:hypothetical protein